MSWIHDVTPPLSLTVQIQPFIWSWDHALGCGHEDCFSSSWFCYPGGSPCPEAVFPPPTEAFPVVRVFLRFLSHTKLPHLIWTQCSHHRIFLPGNTSTGSFIYLVLSRNFVSWKYHPLSSLAEVCQQVHKLSDRKNDKDMMISQTFFFFFSVKLAKQTCLFIYSVMTYKSDSGRADFFPEYQKLRSN